METKQDNPLALLNKPSYNRVVLKLKGAHLDLMYCVCCHKEQGAAKLYKWIPNDQNEITNGESGKRIMKLKEQSLCSMRCLTLASCRGYETKFKAENTGRVVISLNKPCLPTFLCLARPIATVDLIKEVRTIKTVTKTIRQPQQENYINETYQTQNTLADLN